MIGAGFWETMSSLQNPRASSNRVLDEYGFLVPRDTIQRSPTAKQSRFVKSQEKEFLLLLEIQLPWSQVRKRYSSKIKKLCRAGIPESLRAQIWSKLANTDAFYKTGVYQELKSKSSTEHRPIFDVIERDINRCYPDHVRFQDPAGQGYIKLI